MRRPTLILPVILACTAPPADSPRAQTATDPTDPPAVACLPRRTWTLDRQGAMMARSECIADRPVVPTERFALCLDAFAPGQAPVGRIPWIVDDVWDPDCGDAVVWPCEQGVACGPTGCTCVCDYAADCAAPAVARAYAGALPYGVSVACEARRCVWSTESRAAEGG